MSTSVLPAEGIIVRVPGYPPTRLLRGTVTWYQGYPYADVDAVYKVWKCIDDYATAWGNTTGFAFGTSWSLPGDWPTYVEKVGLLSRVWGFLTTGAWPPATRVAPVGGRYVEEVFRRRVPAEWVSVRFPEA